MSAIDNKKNLDEIVFENRNQEYGAYDIRKKYRAALFKGLALAVLIILASVLTPFLMARINKSIDIRMDATITVERYDNLDKPDDIKIPEAEEEKQLIEKVSFTTINVVDSEEDFDYAAFDSLMSKVDNGEVSDIDELAYKVDVDLVTSDVVVEPDPVLFAEEPAEFKSGNQGIMDTIRKYLVYPQAAVEANIEGKVFVRFVVGLDGEISRVELARGAHPLLDNEAKRVVQYLKGWKSAKQNGRLVPMWFTLPINFQLSH